MTYIGEDAFADFKALSKIVIPQSVEKTGGSFLAPDFTSLSNNNVRTIIWGNDTYEIADPHDFDCLWEVEEKIRADGHPIWCMWGGKKAAPAPAGM